MNVLLTGVTGNIGSALAEELHGRRFQVTALVRGGQARLGAGSGLLANIIDHDLLSDAPIACEGPIDAIVHAAGIVRFTAEERANERMMAPVIAFAKQRGVPLHFVSTAFVYAPEPDSGYHNAYEADKAAAEAVLASAGVSFSLLRPSVITGDTRTGALRSYSGYYLMVRAFVGALRAAEARGRKLRFPRMQGTSNLMPVDSVARAIVDAVTEDARDTRFIVNPAPPNAERVLAETLGFFGVEDVLETLDEPFGAYRNRVLTEEEGELARFATHFAPYWSAERAFPESACRESGISDGYLARTLERFVRDTDFHA